MQVSILSGIYSNMAAQYRVAYPRNLMPVAEENGISKGYLKTVDGIDSYGTGAGVDRGGMLWDGTLYRVMGSKLVSVADDGTVSELGEVGPGAQISIDYSFDKLAIASNGRLYYWNGTLTQVTDPDLGNVVDMLWADGFFVTTDGTFIVVTELNDPLAVDPLKYGSSEYDPDPVKGLIKLSGEIYVGNRYTIEVFQNRGGAGFPYQRIDGALISRGFVGTHCKTLFADSFAFMGGARNEPCAIWLAASGGSSKLSTSEIDRVIAQYSEAELSACLLETRKYDGHELLYVHLPNETWVYDATTSIALGVPIWFSLHSAIDATGAYRARNFVYAYNQWICGDTQSSALGKVFSEPTQFGSMVGWQFDTTLLYNASKGAIVNSLELVALTGRSPTGRNPQIFASWTHDGLTWSNERATSAGQRGDYLKRIVWRMLGMFRNWRGLRFRGADDAMVSFSRLEAELEPLNA